jgi:hypothetical protein
MLALVGCGRAEDRQVASNQAQDVTPANEAAPPITPPGTGPDAHTPFAPVKLAFDPKSSEAAGQVVQHYAALIEQNRFDDAEKLWGNEQAAAAFSKGLHPWTHAEIGELGQTEGAAGSIYITIPVVFYGDTFRRPAEVILRRVNDVPGSTEAERRWHIERIDWAPN